MGKTAVSKPTRCCDTRTHAHTRTHTQGPRENGLPQNRDREMEMNACKHTSVRLSRMQTGGIEIQTRAELNLGTPFRRFSIWQSFLSSWTLNPLNPFAFALGTLLGAIQMTAKPLEVSPPKPLLHSHGLHPQPLPSQPFCLWSCGCKHIGLKSKFSACVLYLFYRGIVREMFLDPLYVCFT